MISLRPCENTKEDALIAFQWRNDPETIASSYCPVPKTWDSFWLEYAECYFEHPEFPPCFVMYQNRHAGFIRFEMEELEQKKVLEIMINIAPDFRRSGIGTRAVSLIKEKSRDKNLFGLIADIRLENEASVKLFEKQNFVFVSQRKEFIPKIQKNCHILRYFYAL